VEVDRERQNNQLLNKDEITLHVTPVTANVPQSSSK